MMGSALFCTRSPGGGVAMTPRKYANDRDNQLIRAGEEVSLDGTFRVPHDEATRLLVPGNVQGGSVESGRGRGRHPSRLYPRLASERLGYD